MSKRSAMNNSDRLVLAEAYQSILSESFSTPLTITDYRSVRDGGSECYTFSDDTEVWIDNGVRSTTKGKFFESWNDLGGKGPSVDVPHTKTALMDDFDKVEFRKKSDETYLRKF